MSLSYYFPHTRIDELFEAGFKTGKKHAKSTGTSKRMNLL